jgi:hypothetical protein
MYVQGGLWVSMQEAESEVEAKLLPPDVRWTATETDIAQT